jgi:hypothetical protein
MTKMDGNAMTNAPIATSEPPDIDHDINDVATKRNRREVAVIETGAKEQELESASPHSSGVLRELALARWRGSTTQAALPPQGDDHQNR